MRIGRSLLSMLILGVCILSQAHSQSISDYFTRVSGPETFYVDATTRGHTVATQYHGPVEVIVSGSWTSANETLDATYKYSPPPVAVNGYSMTIGMNGCAWWLECGGRHYCNWIYFIEGQGFTNGHCHDDVQAQCLPPYSDDHAYHFVLNFGSEPVVPTFGMGDGGVYDNSGGLNLTIYQLEENAPLGACCQAGGTCTLTTEANCEVPGAWQGAGTDCDPNPCDEDTGSIIAWGDSRYEMNVVPLPNAAFIAMTAGYYHNLGLRADGTIVAWGNNNEGQCNIPEPNTGFAAVAAGATHSLGLKTDGSIVAWGDNRYEQVDVPMPNTGFVAIAAGHWHNLGLKADGTIVAWGNDDYGQCDVPEPNSRYIAVAGGWYSSMGLKSDGSIVAWGSNGYGQNDVPDPNTGFVAIAEGGGHGLGLTGSGSIVAWGYNDYGQCAVPAPNSDFVGVAAGVLHSLGLKVDGSIVGWGDNSYGQCELPVPNANFAKISAAGLHSLGLHRYPAGACCRTDGTCLLTLSAECLPPNEYLGDGMTCLPNTCPPGGACCESDGTCIVTTEVNCVSPGIWHGAGTTCDPNPCFTGACCLQTVCDLYVQLDCLARGGFYNGNGTLCEPNPCVSGVEDASQVTSLSLTATPNPSTGQVVIRYTLPRATAVTIEVFDAAGALVRRIDQGQRPAGAFSTPWDGRDDNGREMPTGVYFARIVTGQGSAMGRAVIAK